LAGRVVGHPDAGRRDGEGDIRRADGDVERGDGLGDEPGRERVALAVVVEGDGGDQLPALETDERHALPPRRSSLRVHLGQTDRASVMWRAVTSGGGPLAGWLKSKRTAGLASLLMVRPEEAEDTSAEARGSAVSSCTDPAGRSPVRVSAGAPGSRPQVEGREAQAQAGCRKPPRREQERGSQHQVNPAASSEKQWRSRAAHVTAKAMLDGQEAGEESPSSPPGVWMGNDTCSRICAELG